MESVRSYDQLIESGARVMWVAAHPDDECFSGALLAKASLRCSNPLHMVVLTHGEGGECCAAAKRSRPLADVRGEEMQEVAKLYRATLRMERSWNAPLPVQSFPPRHEIARKWLSQGDPAEVIRAEICSFKPDVLLTFSPLYGSTGHPEHQLTSRFAMDAVRRAAEASLGPAAHRVPHAYFVLNRYGWLRLLGMQSDPLGPTETFDVRQACVDGLRCVEVMARNTLPHETQARDMGMMRRLSRFLRLSYLRRVDPFVDMYHPLEVSLVRGMG